MTQPGAAGVITRRADPVHTRRSELRRDRGVARARYDGARRVADRSAITDRQPLALTNADRDPDGDGLGAWSGVGVPARIPLSLANGFGERHVQRVGVAEPARFGDGFGLAGHDSYAGTDPVCLDRTGQG